MLRSVTIASLTLLLASPVLAQAPTDRVPLTVTRAELQIIGQGLMELPYKTAASVMNDLQAQLNSADAAAAKAAAEVAKPAEGNLDKGAGPMVPAAKALDEPAK